MSRRPPPEPDDAETAARERRERRELEAAGQLGLPADALGLDADEEPADADDEPDEGDQGDDPDELEGLDPQAVGAAIAGFIAGASGDDEDLEPAAGAVTTATPRRGWNRPRPPTVNPKPPTEPIKPPPITGTGPVVEVRRASDLKTIRSNTTYQWVGGYVHREQVAMNGLNHVTFIDPRIEGAYESNIYARNFNVLTITGGDLSNSKTKDGILVDGDSQGLRMVRVSGKGNGEHFIYLGAWKKGGTPFYIEDCIGTENDRCAVQINLEGRDWWIVGGHILRCTFDGNAGEEGSQCNLAAWDGGLFQDNHVINGHDDGVILCAIDGKASKNCRIVGCTFRDNDDAPLKAVDGSKGHTLSKCVFDEMPTMTGIRSDKTNLCNGRKF